jgi:hypothetical protein
VVSDDARFMAFQMAKSTDVSGWGMESLILTAGRAGTCIPGGDHCSARARELPPKSVHLTNINARLVVSGLNSKVDSFV